MLVRQLEDEVVKAKTQASHTNPEVSAVESMLSNLEDNISFNILPGHFCHNHAFRPSDCLSPSDLLL